MVIMILNYGNHNINNTVILFYTYIYMCVCMCVCIFVCMYVIILAI